MTPEHIDAVLPRVPAGIPALTGDLTDPDERAEAIDWLMSFYGAAEDQQGTRTPSDTPAALRNEHRAESEQHTLTAQTTIVLPCDCDRQHVAAGDQVFHIDPSSDNNGLRSANTTFAVCVVAGVRQHGWIECSRTGCQHFGPPAWLIEARDGTCEWCGGVVECDCPSCERADYPFVCSDCIDGRPAVEVVEPCRCIGPAHTVTPTHSRGRGTVEHVLPVVNPGPCHPPFTPCVEWWPNEAEANLWLTDDQEHGIPLDIAVAPGQYVVLVRMEDA